MPRIDETAYRQRKATPTERELSTPTLDERLLTQQGVPTFLPVKILSPASLASIPPAPLTVTQLARGVPFTPTSPLVQRNFPGSSMHVAPLGGAKQKKPSKTRRASFFY